MYDDVLDRSHEMKALLDLARGAIEDGVVTEDEANAFNAWVERHAELAATPHVVEIVRRLRHIFADGTVSESNRKKLHALLQDLTGERPTAPDPSDDSFDYRSELDID